MKKQIKFITLPMTGKEFFASEMYSGRWTVVKGEYVQIEKGLRDNFATSIISASFNKTGAKTGKDAGKESGAIRKMQYQLRVGKRKTPTGIEMLVGGETPYHFASFSHESITDFQKYKAWKRNLKTQPDLRPDCYRALNFNGLRWLQINKVRYSFKPDTAFRQECILRHSAYAQKQVDLLERQIWWAKGFLLSGLFDKVSDLKAGLDALVNQLNADQTEYAESL